MSEKFTSRADTWDAKKATHDKEAFEDAVYADAGTKDFSDEARQRVDEGDAYSKHMESLAERSADHDTIDDEQLDAVDRAIDSDAALRRMKMMAESIAMEVTQGKDTTERENKLQELMLNYDGDTTTKVDGLEKEGIFDRIIELTRQTGGQESVASTSDSAPDRTEAANAEAAQESAPETDASNQSIDDNEVGESLGLTPEEIRAKRAQMVREGIAALDVGNMSNDEISRYNLVSKESDGELSDDNESEDSFGLTPEEIQAKRAKMVREGIAPLDVGNMSDDEISRYNLVSKESDEPVESDAELDDDNDHDEDDTDADADDDAPADGVEVSLEGLTASDDESENTEDTPVKRRRAHNVLRNLGSTTGMAVEFGNLMKGMHNRSRGDNPRSYRNRVIGGMALVLAAGGGLLLMSKGHDVSAIVPPESPQPPKNPEAVADVIKGLNFKVEAGHGYSDELQQFASANGHKLSPEQAYQLHLDQVKEFGKDYIDINGAGNDIYMHGSDVRLSEPGKATWAKGVPEFLNKWMKDRNL